MGEFNLKLRTGRSDLQLNASCSTYLHMSPLTAALLSIASAITVAFLSHALTSRRKQRDELAEFRLKAYTDFINAASRLVSARRLGEISDEIKEIALLNDAKTRICICAEAPVVRALVEFWKHGGTLEKEREILAFTRFCMLIRESLGGRASDLNDINISQTLFKLQPATYSYLKEKQQSQY